MKRIEYKTNPAEFDRRWIARHLAKTVRDKNGCVLWQGRVQWTGYAQASYRGRNLQLHRKLYELIKGVELRRDQDVCHSCDVRHCVNMDHLWIGSRSENMYDAISKGRHPEAAQTHCWRGHEYNEANTYHTGVSRQCKACHIGRHRVRAGWPEDLAYSLPAVRHGYRPVNASWKKMKRRRKLSSTGATGEPT